MRRRRWDLSAPGYHLGKSAVPVVFEVHAQTPDQRRHGTKDRGGEERQQVNFIKLPTPRNASSRSPSQSIEYSRYSTSAQISFTADWCTTTRSTMADPGAKEKETDEVDESSSDSASDYGPAFDDGRGLPEPEPEPEDEPEPEPNLNRSSCGFPENQVHQPLVPAENHRRSSAGPAF
eukprot:SAG22_NODE_6784_length_811_cov_1.485955_2_plen_177_part_00